MVPVSCYYSQWALSSLHQLINVAKTIHYSSFTKLVVYLVLSFQPKTAYICFKKQAQRLTYANDIGIV
jgi:hypothetical protein